MSRKNILFYAGLGFAVGYIVRDQLHRYQKLTPDKALQYAKEIFQKNGPINGS